MNSQCPKPHAVHGRDKANESISFWATDPSQVKVVVKVRKIKHYELELESIHDKVIGEFLCFIRNSSKDELQKINKSLREQSIREFGFSII